ncbi:MAG: hypothetical protein QCI00_02900 [Candidatus Thermoplasmatota archaeon]|nr:hypothetical protein [Candidatus Thermoplasmatota archaeon]
MDERIIGIIPNVSSGFFGQKSFNLIVTDKRLIVAIVTNKMLSEAIKQTREESKDTGDGVLKRMAKTASAGYTFHKKYFNMSPDKILAENTENFYLNQTMIKKIKVILGTYIPEKGISNPNELKIKATNGKYKFLFSNMSTKEVKTLLSHPFGNLVK